MLLVHIGGWIKGNPEKYYFITRAFQEIGFVVACAQYRLIDDKAEPPVGVNDPVSDTQDTMRYLRTHARELAIDPKRIVAIGHSAGCLVPFNPTIDTSRAGYGYRKLSKDWETCSPLHRLEPGLPPTIVSHGTGDKTTPALWSPIAIRCAMPYSPSFSIQTTRSISILIVRTTAFPPTIRGTTSPWFTTAPCPKFARWHF